MRATCRSSSTSISTTNCSARRYPSKRLYFHSRWSRNNPCNGWGPDLQTNSPEVNIVDLDGRDNYVVLDTTGSGHYVGCNLSVYHRQGSWWGEGNDMIFIDDDTWPPSLHGTGTEDYFNHAWGMQTNAYAYHGGDRARERVPGIQSTTGSTSSTPSTSPSASRSPSNTATATTSPTTGPRRPTGTKRCPSPVATIPPLAERLPTRPETPPTPSPAPRTGAVADEITQMRSQRDERFAMYSQRMTERTTWRNERSRAESRANIEQAAALRRRFQ